MAKKIKPAVPSSPAKKDRTPSAFLAKKWQQYALILGGLMVLFLILLKPLVIDKQIPQGVDVLSSQAGTKHVQKTADEFNEFALYNPYIFNGMPSYHRIGPKAWSVDIVLQFLSGEVFSKEYVYYLLGAIGMLILLTQLGLSPFVALIGVLIFVLVPHFQALWSVGHMAKFRAIMYLPWVILAFRYLTQTKSLLSAALFALAFGLQIRTQHYQIIFYTGLMILAIAIEPFLRSLIEKKYQDFGKLLGLAVLAGGLAVLSAAQPIFLANEYLPYSKRGKTTADITDTKSVAGEQGSGVSSTYATQWSTHPSELKTWIIPRALGGTSGEVYDGKKFPHLDGKAIPGYWGHMPFTQSYEYFGVISCLLALLGIWFLMRRNKFMMALGLISVFFILLSFGRHFQGFYDIFFNNVPYFNKFRAPMMSVTMIYFVVGLFAAMGLNHILYNLRDKDRLSVLYVVLGFMALLLILYVSGISASFTKPSGENYKPEEMIVISQIREEMFSRDAIRSILLAGLAGGIVLLAAWRKIKPGLSLAIIAVLILIDLIGVQQRQEIDYVDLDKLARENFTATSTDNVILQDKDVFRVFPVGKLFGDNRWIYHHSSIGGYSPIKPYAIEEVIENSLYNGWEENFPVNWNVLRMLNVKYVILNGDFRHPLLEPVNRDQANGLSTFRFKDWKQRAFFVDNYEVIPDEIQRLNRLNQQDLNTSYTALLETEPNTEVFAPDSSRVDVIRETLLKREFVVFTDKSALLVLSENYYPPGWHITMDGVKVDKVYRADHTIQAIVVPAGEHQILMEFHPDSFYTYMKVSWIAMILILLGVALPLGWKYFQTRKPSAGNA